MLNLPLVNWKYNKSIQGTSSSSRQESLNICLIKFPELIVFICTIRLSEPIENISNGKILLVIKRLLIL